MVKNQLENLVSEFPQLSIRKAASAVDVFVYHIFHDDMHLKPYKFHLWHKLEDKDYEKRLNFAQTWLKDKFDDKFIDKDMWPPRSLDLNPCDFYLWGHLKSMVYNRWPKTLDDLKANIEREITKISKNILELTF